MATAKQQIFINEYLKSWNATQAAQAAGYAHPNKSGPRLLVDDGIRAEIDQRLEALKMDADQTIIKLTEMAEGFDLTNYFKIRDVYRKNAQGSEYLWGQIVDFDLEKLQEDGFGYLVKEVKQNAQGGVDVKFYDRFRPLVEIAKYHGLFTQKVDITTGGDNLGENFVAALDLVYGPKESK